MPLKGARKKQYNKAYFAKWYATHKGEYNRKRKSTWKKWYKKHKAEYNKARREKYAERKNDSS